MPNGRKGDNPLSDILIWNCEVYGPEIDALVREVAALEPPHELDEHGIARSPLGEPPLVDLIFDAETDPAQRPRLREELLALRTRLTEQRERESSGD